MMMITLCAVAHAFHTVSSIEPRSVLTRRSAVTAGLSLPGARALRKLRGRGGASGPITAAEVEAAQDAWAAGVVHVGKVFSDGGDYAAEGKKVLDDLYGYASGFDVLFKPTKAADPAVRLAEDECISYFVSREYGAKYKEDNGFAITPWKKVRFDNKGTLLLADSATAMGEYYFTGTDGSEAKVEYTFQYRRADDGSLKIVVHHSSIPYKP